MNRAFAHLQDFVDRTHATHTTFTLEVHAKFALRDELLVDQIVARFGAARCNASASTWKTFIAQNPVFPVPKLFSSRRLAIQSTTISQCLHQYNWWMTRVFWGLAHETSFGVETSFCVAWSGSSALPTKSLMCRLASGIHARVGGSAGERPSLSDFVVGNTWDIALFFRSHLFMSTLPGGVGEVRIRAPLSSVLFVVASLFFEAAAGIFALAPLTTQAALHFHRASMGSRPWKNAKSERLPFTLAICRRLSTTPRVFSKSRKAFGQ